MTQSDCPCGLMVAYDQCCGLYHVHYHAPTALALMRSRYSAFCLGKIDYIEQTMKDKALIGFNPNDVTSRTASVHWIGLQIIAAFNHPNTLDTSYVEFIARFIEKGYLKSIHEVSEFKYINNRWYYVDGSIDPDNKHQKPITIPLNAPCPCNRLKKFKNCHGKM